MKQTLIEIDSQLRKPLNKMTILDPVLIYEEAVLLHIWARCWGILYMSKSFLYIWVDKYFFIAYNEYIEASKQFYYSQS